MSLRRVLSAALVFVIGFVIGTIGVMSTATFVSASDIPKDILTQRDPFKMPTIEKNASPVSELQMYPADQFRVVGVLRGVHELRAMVISPNGKTYFVKKGTRIGTRKGAIRKITEEAVIVREKIVNVLGDAKSVDTVLKLPSDAKQDVRTTTLEQGW